MKRIEITTDNKKQCSKCKQLKDLNEFSKNKALYSGLDGKCKECLCLDKHKRPYKGQAGTYNLKSIEYQNGTKLCTKCKIIKLKTEFIPIRDNKLKSYCRKCLRLQQTLNRFKLDEQEYHNIYKNQNGLCKICNNTDINRELAIDHCHTTGKIRGLLCQKCNTAIGLLKEDIKILQKAINYLKEAK